MAEEKAEQAGYRVPEPAAPLEERFIFRLTNTTDKPGVTQIIVMGTEELFTLCDDERAEVAGQLEEALAQGLIHTVNGDSILGEELSSNDFDIELTLKPTPLTAVSAGLVVRMDKLEVELTQARESASKMHRRAQQAEGALLKSDKGNGSWNGPWFRGQKAGRQQATDDYARANGRMALEIKALKAELLRERGYRENAVQALALVKGKGTSAYEEGFLDGQKAQQLAEPVRVPAVVPGTGAVGRAVDKRAEQVAERAAEEGALTPWIPHALGMASVAAPGGRLYRCDVGLAFVPDAPPPPAMSFPSVSTPTQVVELAEFVVAGGAIVKDRKGNGYIDCECVDGAYLSTEAIARLMGVKG